MRRKTTAVLLAGAALMAGCSGDDAAQPAPSTQATPSATSPASASASPVTPSSAATPTPPPNLAVAGIVAEGLDVPWGLAFLPDRSALVAERDTGLIKRIAPGGQVSEVGNVPGVRPLGEGGLLGLAVAPTFSQDRWLYAYFTASGENRIVRMRYDGSGLGPPEVLVDGIPAGSRHNGGRLVFGPDGMLYAGTGESGDPPLGQDRGSLGGKILRIAPDGGVPRDNPFPGSYVWTYGHRNVQGLAFTADGRLWASEFGQNTWDELNLIEKGRNYGWPDVEGRGGDSRFVDPVAQWPTDEASPSGVAVAGDAVYMAALKGERLWQIPISRQGVGRPRAFFTGKYGRMRTVALAPDGSLWVTTSNTDGRGSRRPGDDKVLRVALRPRSP
jgi:glucose/arabinose dehydrogenase